MFTLATFSIAVIIIIIIVMIMIIIVVIIIAIIIVIIVIIMIIIIAVSACIALIQFTLALICLTRDLLFAFRFIRFYEVFMQTSLSNAERNWLSVKRLLYIWRL